MPLLDRLIVAVSNRLERKFHWGLIPLPEQILDRFEIDKTKHHELAATASGDFAKLFYSHKGRLTDKLAHYLEVYECHFARYRGTPVRMLEIGVFQGGSLELWRKYFGEHATIFGIDINPDCSTRVDAPNKVRIGSQDDPNFLRSVVAEMGPPDIVLDDGSHVASHQRRSFEVLFPLLNPGGLYVTEDMATSYWRVFQGGYLRRGTAIEIVKSLIDDLHHWWHLRTPRFGDEIAAIHVYDSIAVIEKRSSPHRPIRVRQPWDAGFEGRQNSCN